MVGSALERRGVALTFGALCASFIARTAAAELVADSARLDRGWHGTILAQSGSRRLAVQSITLSQSSNIG